MGTSRLPANNRQPSCQVFIAVLALSTSYHAFVAAQAPAEAAAEAPAQSPSQTVAGDGCASVLLAVGSYDTITWIEPQVTGEGVSIMNLMLCGSAAAPTATLETDLLIGTGDTGSNPGFCDQFDSTTIICANEVGSATEDGTAVMLDLSSAAPAQFFPLNVSTPVYIELLSNGLVATANYGGGSFTTFDPMADPSSAVIQTVEIPQTNATLELGNIDRQEAPHPHMATEVVDGEILVPDLGSDAVYQYSVSSDGMLTWQGATNLTAGDGPRHVAVGRMGKVYLVAELSRKILELDSTCDTGAVGAGRGVCSEVVIPEPEDRTVYQTASALRVSKDQEFVYASLRRVETIGALGGLVGYKIQTNGSLGELVGLWDSGGQQPRDFALVDVPGFKEVFVVANRKSNSVDVLDRDAVTGEVGAKLVSAAVNSPTSVLVLQNITAADVDGSAFAPVVSTAAAAPVAAAPAPVAGQGTGSNDTEAGDRALESAAPASSDAQAHDAAVDVEATNAATSTVHGAAGAQAMALTLALAGGAMLLR